MNAPAAGVSRRRFLTRLFTNTPATSSLSPLDDLHRHTDGVLWAALATSDGEQYVAGDDGMVFRFDGKQWVREDFPSRLPVHALSTSGGRIYSVGWLGQICERLDDRWRPIQGGGVDTARENFPLFDIEADNGGGLWTVGDHGRVVNFDGEAWREVDCGSEANLRAVLPLADGSVLVAGAGGTARLYREGAWSAVETCTGCTIVSMAALGEDTVIAVGGEYDVEAGQFRGRIFLYNGDHWQLVESEHPLPRLRRVRRADDALLICGDDGVAFRWDADGARRLRTRVRHDLHDLIITTDGKALICGDGSTLLQETAASGATPANVVSSPWRRISDGETNRTLRSVLAVSDNHLIAAGDGGTILHIEGDGITPRETPQGLRIHGLWASSPRNVFAACDDATILHFDGEHWEIAHRGAIDTALLAIAGFGPHDIFAVGDNGFCLRYDGLMWRRLETGVRQELYALWGLDSQHLLAVGGGGLVLRFNGERWQPFSAGTDLDLYGVCGSGLQQVYLSGLAGTLIRFENNRWHRDFSGVRSDLHAVTRVGDTFYAAGANGTLLRRTQGLWEPEPAGCEVTLHALTGVGTTLYAVGSDGTVLRRRH